MRFEPAVPTPDPTSSDGLAAKLRGDLAEILALAAAPEARCGRRARETFRNECSRGSQLSVVAGHATDDPIILLSLYNELRGGIAALCLGCTEAVAARVGWPGY